MAELYKFQSEAVDELLGGKHFIIAGCGSGKNPMSVVWAAKECAKTLMKKILVVTTASKARTSDHLDDFNAFVPEEERAGVTVITISWHKLAKWVRDNCNEIDSYVYIFDEVQRAKAGFSSGMGRAFLKITSETGYWSAFTGTPGDTWLSFYPYFTACGLVRNKTSFMHEYANVQTYKGYPEIIGWRSEDKLRKMWDEISFAPDTSSIVAELPEQTHKVFTFKKSKGYIETLRNRRNADGDILDTAGALCAELRRQCFTKEKQEWVKDFVTDLESGCVFFYNFIKTGDELEQIITKAIPKGARVWRIDGKHHDIPKADTIGPHDMVICQWQSGSEALNLQFLHYWVAVELCYSYSTAIQARGRIRRIGQKMPQWYGYLLTEGTIEGDILECLKGKSEFSEKVWCISKHLTKDEDG